jgi:hypothetical protein
VSQRLQSYIRKSGAEITADLMGLAEDREEQGSHHTCKQRSAGDRIEKGNWGRIQRNWEELGQQKGAIRK